MDWQKILNTLKKFFLGIWEILKYYVPLIIQKIWDILKIVGAFLGRTFSKFIKWLKKYIRQVIKHTKKGDYSLLIYTALALVAIILIIVLLVSAIGGGKKKKKSTTEASTEEITTEDPAIAQHNQLVTEAKTIYQNNQSLLIMVSNTSPLDASYTFEHHTLNCGKDIDKRSLENLRSMLQACNDAGNEYNIISAYRDRTAQQTLFDNEVSRIVAAEGISQEEATQKAHNSVQPAGCSEHETGLAIDLSSLNTTTLDQYVADDSTNQWLMNNSYRYGFILRYPADKIAITGIDFEPWHFRYVGVEAATFMYNNNLCLEEFYGLINEQ